MNMQTLRKKTSPLKYKNETTRFLGDGVSFKAKLIGILEVSEARGDRMCQEALSDLKMAIRAAGEHKQRITINIAIDGLRLRDEKTGDSLYHHPVHKISFIAQDMSDSRAFGYIFGSPDTGHRFFGIKTDKAASQVVIAMRDLFQVVFALKKKEIELAKQHLDKGRYTSSPLFSDSTVSSSSKLQSVSHETTSKTTTTESKAGAASSESKSGGTAVADLVDLELELNSLQQGLNQMERITPSDPFGSKDDPFGDSFTSYMKPILPPPPSGRERASRTSDTSIFSPRTAVSLDTTEPTSGKSAKSRTDFSFSQDFSSSREEPSSGDWFTPSGGNSIFEETSLVPEPTKDEKHELAKQEILSQFDVFTELDPLELKNPPKKVLKDLVSQTQPSDQPQSLPQNLLAKTLSHGGAPKTAPSGGDLTDPFGEDPFVTEDPFAGADFSKQDPFENEFNDGKISNKFGSKSPGGTMFEKQRNTVQFKQTFQNESNKSKLMQLHENPSLDMSSESECAPEPPPRPTLTLSQIKPPPLPPKKQANDLSIKPPPRPPHSEDPHYDYMDNYETAPSSLEFVNKANVDKSPPLPVPARKARFETDFSNVPERPKKPYEDDYLTPISLPPPQRAAKKIMAQVTVASYLESKPNLVTSNCSLEGLDITLSQLTLSGLNELATKLNIPSNQLSNMTLVQLTNYLSNVIKSKNENANNTTSTSNTTPQQVTNESPVFKADFAANFSNITDHSYDRYAVFRELMEEEIKQTKIDTEPEEIKEEKEQEQEQEQEKEQKQELDQELEQEETAVPPAENASDKYAALREIVESEFKQNNKIDEEEEEEEPEEEEEEEEEEIAEESNENIVNLENKLNTDDMKEKEVPPKYLIEYNAPLDNEKPVSPKSITTVKSPVPVAITEIIQNNARLTSGSLSDVISNSSPEVDNTASNSEIGKGKEDGDAAGESWAIFDQGGQEVAVKEKQAVQSEEGVSPWSSDSKEFGNGSPPDWRRGDSGSGGDHWPKRRAGARRDQEGWWDTSAEPETQYYQSSANRRSTDSYEEEYYECYERPRRRKAPAYVHGGAGQATGGHSSSSRDVSPWEEEPRRRDQRPGWPRHPRQHSFEKHRDRRHTDSWDEEDDYEYEDEHVARFHRPERHAREVERDRHSAGSRDHDGERWGDDGWSADRRHRRKRDSDRDRRCCQDCDQIEHEKHLRYGGRYTNVADGPPGMWRERKHDDRYYSRESQESPWDEDEYSNHEAEEVHPASHYLTAKRNWKRPSSASEIDRKTGEIKSRHYLGTGSSDGERDRSRYKPGRRSRSRDSQYSEPVHRHKPEVAATARSPHSRGTPKQYSSKAHFEGEPPETKPDLHANKKSSTLARKKPKESPKSEENVISTFPRKAKAKPLFENDFSEGTVLSPRTRFNFDNEFETSEAESPTIVNKPLKGLRQQSLFEKSQLAMDSDFKESFRQRSLKESRLSPRFQSSKAKSMFEDDFSPSDRPEPLPEDISISSIKEETDPNEAEDSFNSTGFENATTNSRNKKKLNKHRLSGNIQDINIKKSESVNIFARESDPFDDDFFSENAASGGGVHDEEQSPRTTDLKWTDDFTDFDIEEGK